MGRECFTRKKTLPHKYSSDVKATSQLSDGFEEMKFSMIGVRGKGELRKPFKKN